MKILKIDHLGIAVKSIEGGQEFLDGCAGAQLRGHGNRGGAEGDDRLSAGRGKRGRAA